MSAQELITEHLDLWTGAVTRKFSSGRGSNGKVELTGVKKLRELILNLAVRGKLVPQNSDEASAASLLMDIEAKKKVLHRAKTIKKPKKVSPPQGDAIPWTLPSCWEWVRLPDIYYPISPSGKKLKSSETLETGQFPVVDQGQSYISGYTDDASLVIEIPHPVIVFGDHTTARKYIDFNFVPGADGTKILCPILVNPRFFYLQLLGYDLENRGYARHFKVLNENFFALPPLEEQHRIVQKVDELMALCDRLEQQTSDQLEAHETLVDTLLGTLTQSENATELADNWARLAAHFDTLFTTEPSIDKLKQTILQLAVMARLVEQDDGDEPTTQLLERVSNEKQRLIQSKVLKRTKSLAPIDTSALPSIPEGWSWVNLGDIISVMDAGWSPACPPRPADPEKWGVLKTTAVQVMKYQEFENKQLPDNKAPKEQYEVRSGDILITRAGPKNRVGISCVVKETRDKLMISDKIIRFHLIETGLSEEYICLCLNAGETYNYLEQAKSGMAESQMNISQDKLKAAPVPLCPANEQHRIIQKVDELMTLCDQLKERLNQASETRCQLAEAVVEKGLSA